MAGWQAKARGAAMVALPTLSVVVAALVFLGPGATAATLGARVYGAPKEGASQIAVRIVLARSLFDVLDSGGAHELLVEGSAPGQTLRAWHGSTDADGVTDAVLESSSPLHGPVALAVTMLGAKPLIAAAGDFSFPSVSPLVPASSTVMGSTRGDLTIQVDVRRGVLAAPFREELRVTLSPPVAAEITYTASGLSFDVPGPITTTPAGIALVRVVPSAHQVELTIDARADGKAGHWEGTLPVVPGATWLEPGWATSSERRVVAPGPRTKGYVSFWSDERVGSAERRSPSPPIPMGSTRQSSRSLRFRSVRGPSW